MLVKLKNKKVLMTIFLIIASPLIIYLLAISSTFILNLGRYLGTIIRAIYEHGFCI
jgi:hypothetical protein